jgi:hypothetical protein
LLGIARAISRPSPTSPCKKKLTLSATARPARRLRPGRRSTVLVGAVRGRRWRLEAARPRVLGVALAATGGRAGRRLQELLQRGAEAGCDGLVAPGNAHPHLALGARLPGLLLQLRRSALRRSARPTSASAARSRLDATWALAPLRLPPPPAPAAPARLAPSHAGMHFF